MKLKSAILILMLGLSLILGASLRHQAHAFELFPQCDNTTTDSTVCQNKDKPESHSSNSFYGKGSILAKAVMVYSMVTGVAAVIVIIISGFRFVTSSGDSNNVKNAKNTLLFAVAGLAVAALGATIVQFVLNKL